MSARANDELADDDATPPPTPTPPPPAPHDPSKQTRDDDDYENSDDDEEEEVEIDSGYVMAPPPVIPATVTSSVTVAATAPQPMSDSASAAAAAESQPTTLSLTAASTSSLRQPAQADNGIMTKTASDAMNDDDDGSFQPATKVSASASIGDSAVNSVSTDPASDPSLIATLRHLMRPFGPLDPPVLGSFAHSPVPLPPASLYPAPTERTGREMQMQMQMHGARKRTHTAVMAAESALSAEQFWKTTRPLLEVETLVRSIDSASTSSFDASAVASVMTPSLPVAPASLVDAFSSQTTRRHISCVRHFLSSKRFDRNGSHVAELWAAHEWRDPYRLLSHPVTPDQAAQPFPPRSTATGLNGRSAAATQAQDRWRALYASSSLPSSPIHPPLTLSSSRSFGSSTISLACAELDTKHQLITTLQQRDPTVIQQAGQTPPTEIYLAFVDLGCGTATHPSAAASASSSSSSPSSSPSPSLSPFAIPTASFSAEYPLWRRRACNLRAKGWGYEIGSMDPRRASQSAEAAAEANATPNSERLAGWRNAIAKDQGKLFDIFYPITQPQQNGTSAIHHTSNDMVHPLSSVFDAMSESHVETFIDMVNRQTRDEGVPLALAMDFHGPAACAVYDAPTMSFVPPSELVYPLVLFRLDVSLRSLARGGNMILALPETHSPLVMSILLLCWKCFGKCTLQRSALATYGSSQCYLICHNFLNDRLTMGPSTSPIINAIRRARDRLAQMRTSSGSASSSSSSSSAAATTAASIEVEPFARGGEHCMVDVEQLQKDSNAPFRNWIKTYNQAADAYQLRCLLSLLQPTPITPGLLPNLPGAKSASSSASSSSSSSSSSTSVTSSSSLSLSLLPAAEPQHRVRLTMLRHWGLQVQDPFQPTTGFR